MASSDGSNRQPLVDVIPPTDPHGADRSSFSVLDVVRDLWTNSLGLPIDELPPLDATDDDGRPVLPSSFRIGILAQSTIATSALAASLIHTRRNSGTCSAPVKVPLQHAVAEFLSERLYTVDEQPPKSVWGTLGGLHKTADGHVRIHDVFPHHVSAMLDTLSLSGEVMRGQVAEKLADWNSVAFETAATGQGKAAAYALRSYQEWDAHAQARALHDQPVSISKIEESTASLPAKPLPATDSKRCLAGLRVVEMSRVIAAPVAGRALAAHGADVAWVTSPNLPDLPMLDLDFARGKRTVQLDIHKEADKQRLMELLRTCDVFIQSYRPGSLAGHGLFPKELATVNPNIICANLSAFGPSGPWAERRGFDSLVQTCSGMNVSEAEHAGKGEVARATPCQCLDHASGYLLASGIMAAVHHRDLEGGAWMIDVSLAGAMKYLRSLGQYALSSAFAYKSYEAAEDVPDEFKTSPQDTHFGSITALKHSASVEGCNVGWEIPPKPLGSDQPEWLS